MRDKGGQKDKNKGQKQKAAKDAAKQKKKRDKQAKGETGLTSSAHGELTRLVPTP